MADHSDGRGIARLSWWLRLIIFFFLLVATYAGSQFGTFYAFKHAMGLPPLAVSAMAGMSGSVVLIAIYRGLVRWTERRGADEVSVHGAITSLLGGAVIGAALFCAVMLYLVHAGVARFADFAWSPDIPLILALSILSGVGEELIFRGAIYRLFEERFGTTVALVISGALFGLIHGGNPGATFASTAAIALEAGLLLAAAYSATRSLWLPVGLHFAWNFTEGGVFGTAVSGHATKGLVATHLTGPDYLTGGRFGPEASVPAVVVCMIAATAFLIVTAVRGEWQPMGFRMRRRAV
jgi:membrane protease YdiL (CAAX protease family)